jgi:hypothetical protein
MNSRRLTIPSAKPNQPSVERSLAQISPALALRHRPLASYATPMFNGLAAFVDGHSASPANGRTGVSFWHKTDMPQRSLYVRSWG